MKKHNADRRKLMRRRRMVRKIKRFMDRCAIVVLLLCVAYLARGVYMHQRSNQITDELRTINHEANSAYDEIESSVAPVFTEFAESLVSVAELEDVANAEDSVAHEIRTVPVAQMEETVSDEVEEEIVVEELIMQDKFADMYERNNDLIGWIRVNEDIDYPIVWRDEDNDFYMNHDYDKNFSDDGWIFLDKRNGNLMNDDQLLIYGHNMRSGSMFGELDRYRKLSYVQEQPFIEIQSIYDAEPRKYVIVSLFDASMNKDHESYIKITNFNFETPEEKQSYIDAISAKSLLDLPCDAVSEDQLVTLVTCSYSQPNGRFLVVARELRDNETAEQIADMYMELK